MSIVDRNDEVNRLFTAKFGPTAIGIKLAFVNEIERMIRKEYEPSLIVKWAQLHIGLVPRLRANRELSTTKRAA